MLHCTLRYIFSAYICALISKQKKLPRKRHLEFESRVNEKIFGKRPAPEPQQGIDPALATILTSLGLSDRIPVFISEDISDFATAKIIFRPDMVANRPPALNLTVGAFMKICIALGTDKSLAPAAAGVTL